MQRGKKKVNFSIAINESLFLILRLIALYGSNLLDKHLFVVESVSRSAHHDLTEAKLILRDPHTR